MPAIYITSTDTFAGKSAVCIGLAMRLKEDGFSFGYMKPISRAIDIADGQPVDRDAEFIKVTFGLDEPMEVLVPIALTAEVEESILRRAEQTDFLKDICGAYEQVSKGKDVILLEAGTNFREGYLIGLPAPRMADVLSARELIVVRHSEYFLDDILAAQASLGPSLLGVIINAVPRPRMGYVTDLVRPYLERKGLPVLGVLPHEQLLQSISVGDLNRVLNGEILCCEDAADALVERLMVGAMSAQSALDYFRRQPNKAVITGGDRPDIQLAALETSTRCLILTGNLRPSDVILQRAQEVHVPIILARFDTLTTIQLIEQYFGKTRFHQQKKIQRFVSLLEAGFDFERFYQILGLTSQRK